MQIASAKGTHIFLTGATGFVGKVVLEELLRRSGEFSIEKIYVLIRPDKKERTPQERFLTEVVASPCFSKLSPNWVQKVEVIGGELTERDCGINESDRVRLAKQITHVINCAASVEFDLPVAIAAAANITSSLNVLEFARLCPVLESMVSVSTAYVTPHRGNDKPIQEELVKLPRPASDLYHAIVNGTMETSKLLKLTGHPNTYTLTKCLAEHLLNERKGTVPLRIVRPSIVSASWKHPFPGWIDSKAAFAGFVALIGAGYLRAVIAQYSTQLDVVPCDEVAKQIIETAFHPIHEEKPIIRHAVAGKSNSCHINVCIEVIENFFRHHLVGRYPDLNYVGSRTFKFRVKDFKHHRAPLTLLASFQGLRGKQKQRRKVLRLLKQVNYLNTGFPYFTHNTFDFHSSFPLNDPAFVKEKYIRTVCQGVYGHLMKNDETEMLLGGKSQTKSQGDLKWTLQQSQGNLAIRTCSYIARKGLRRCTDKITFDHTSFTAAREAAPKDALTVIVPTHRSYMDFVLCSYLFFAHPDLGIAIPHIAAADEFSKIPILGKLFRHTQAFYVKRGLGRENPELTKKVHELVARKQTLEFFIEGTRSRSRKFLKPRRGMLKCLQVSGETCAILPVAISYDHLPEEAAFMRELHGGSKPTMHLRSFLKWLWSLVRGKIDLGRIHITCGQPLILNQTTDLKALGREIIGQLQTLTATTTHHLRCFLKRKPIAGVDLKWLVESIEKRGGKVLESPLENEAEVDRPTERCMRYHWMHHFYPEARAAFPDHPAIQHHISHNSYLLTASQPISEITDARVIRLLRGLFESVCQDYLIVAQSLGSPTGPLQVKSPREIIRNKPAAHLPNLEAAFEDLVARQILSPIDEEGEYAWGPRAKDIEAYQANCAWPERQTTLAAVG